MDIVERLRFGVALDEQGDVSWCNQEAMINAADEIERLREENKRLRELNQHKTMQGRLDGRTVILHQSGDVWVPHWQEDPEVQGGE